MSEYPGGRWSTQRTPCMPSQQPPSPMRDAVRSRPCAASSASLRSDATHLCPNSTPRQYPVSTLVGCYHRRRARTGRTGAQQLRAGGAGADRVGVEVAPSVVALVKVAAAWIGRIRLIAAVGLAGCRCRTLARRRVDDRVIACRALIAPILAPRVAGCTRRRRRSGSKLRTASNRARCRRRV